MESITRLSTTILSVRKLASEPATDMHAAVAYPLAALAEIAGCFAIWAWWRLGATSLWLVPGILSLAIFGWLLAQVETAVADVPLRPMAASILRRPCSGCGWPKANARTDGTW